MSEIMDWFNQLPVFTRHWFALSILFPLLGRVGILSPYFCILTDDFIKSFHIWRPITALFYYPITPQTGFQFLMNLYFLYNYSLQLETGFFSGRPADYLFMLLFNWASITLIAYWAEMPLLMYPMILSVLYVWCQLNKETIVRFWFGTQFRAQYLPWVLFGFNLILNGGGFNELIGILVGHLYYYLMFTYPQEHGSAPLIRTPNILTDYFPSAGHVNAQSANRRTTFTWRGGHRLGSS